MSLDIPDPKKPYVCDFPGCLSRFNKPSRLDEHQNKHTGERPFMCDYEGCTKKYGQSKHLAQHVMNVHKHERPFVCEKEDCGHADFTTSTRLKRHIVEVHEKGKAFPCVGHDDDCEEAFRKKSALERHVRKAHQGLLPYLCPEKHCGMAHNSASSLRRHKDKIHGEKKFWCETCGEACVGYTTLAQLKGHMTKEHLKCPFCDFTSSSKENIGNHIDMQHLDEQVAVPEAITFPCPWDGCTKTYSKKSNLNTHIRSKHEKVRFVCGEVDVSKVRGLENWDMTTKCDEPCSSKASLVDHIRFVHMKLPRPPNMRGKRDQSGQRDATPAVDEVSGALDAAKRILKCTEPGCDHKFIRDYDLEQHLKTYLHSRPDLAAPRMGGQENQETGVDLVGPQVGGYEEGYEAAVDPLEPQTVGQEVGYEEGYEAAVGPLEPQTVGQEVGYETGYEAMGMVNEAIANPVELQTGEQETGYHAGADTMEPQAGQDANYEDGIATVYPPVNVNAVPNVAYENYANGMFPHQNHLFVADNTNTFTHNRPVPFN
ncbi:C2H2-type zinc finger protein [Candidatus Bathyarchaeota archaeon]|nr:C2H2-type zinc finger protein [Candidatus Bathyarchaeota archaeon]